MLVETAEGGEILVMIGDGGSPETFAHDCLINSARGIEFALGMTENAVPDCDNPLDPDWIRRTKATRSVTITGEGMLDVTSVELWDTWALSKEPKNVLFKINKAGARQYTGSFHLTAFSINASDNKELATASVTLMSDGAVTPAAAVVV